MVYTVSNWKQRNLKVFLFSPTIQMKWWRHQSTRYLQGHSTKIVFVLGLVEWEWDLHRIRVKSRVYWNLNLKIQTYKIRWIYPIIICSKIWPMAFFFKIKIEEKITSLPLHPYTSVSINSTKWEIAAPLPYWHIVYQ